MYKQKSTLPVYDFIGKTEMILLAWNVLGVPEVVWVGLLNLALPKCIFWLQYCNSVNP